MLCERCQQREATVFSTHIIFGETTTNNLCEQCFAASPIEPLPGLPFPSLDGASCFYCGAPADGASLNDAYAFASRQQRFHFTCHRCGQISNSFLLEALSTFPKGLPPERERLCFEQLFREADARVRAFLGDAE
jgi:hypothetical protein